MNIYFKDIKCYLLSLTLILLGCIKSNQPQNVSNPTNGSQTAENITFSKDSQSFFLIDRINYTDAVMALGNSIKDNAILDITAFSAYPTQSIPGSGFFLTNTEQISGETINQRVIDLTEQFLDNNNIFLPGTSTAILLESMLKNANTIARVTHAILLTNKQAKSGIPTLCDDAINLYKTNPSQFEQKYGNTHFSFACGGNIIICLEAYSTNQPVNNEIFRQYITMTDNHINKFAYLSKDDISKISQFFLTNAVERKVLTLSTINLNANKISCARDINTTELSSTPKLISFGKAKTSDFIPQ